MFPVLLLLVTLQSLVAAQTIISVPNRQNFGAWGTMEVQRRRGFLGDWALNGIALHCTEPSSWEVVKTIHSTEGAFGSWGPDFWCNLGNLIGFSLRVDPRDTWDNTAANNIKFMFSDGSVMEGNGQSGGNYGPWSPKCENGMCGIQTRVQERLWDDDVSLTDVKFMCCS